MGRGRETQLREALERRILVLDGAMGTSIQRHKLTAEDYGGQELEGCNENLVSTRPDVIRSIHEGYLAAGADIIETDSFGSIRHVLAEYGLQDPTAELARASARLAAEACAKFSSPDKPRFVGASLGPGTKSISITGGITFDEVRRNYGESAQALLEGGADLFFVETQQDTLNIKASLLGLEDAFARLGRRAPIVLSVSIETMGVMLGGQTVEALYDSVSGFDLLAVGLNCATGPDFMSDHLRALSGISRFYVSCFPNAGLPDEDGRYNETPEMIARKLGRLCDEGLVNIVGGCCGTTAEHIGLIARMAQGKPPRRPAPARRAAVAGLESLVIEDEKRPVLVGERTNVIGSRIFKDLIAADKFEEASEIGRRQARHGAQILDVCLADPDRDEKADMIRFLEFLTRKVKTPLMIDTTDPGVLEEALKRCPGKCVVNSINLEDGEERFAAVVLLLRRYGGAVVVGTIDEDKARGMAVSRERKAAIARRAHALLTGKYGLAPEDLYFDPLVFPCATGDKNYHGSAAETIEGVRLIKQALPRCKTVLGVSNVSFGLPPAAREALNAVFLHHCVQAGLDLAIVNAEKLARYATLPEGERKLAEALLFPRDAQHAADAIAAFSAAFREAASTAKPKASRSELPLEERLAQNVVEGSKEGLIEGLSALLEQGRKPLEIVNGPLMRGMAEVGRLFAANALIVAEVLQSAEVMKAAVAHLEPHGGRGSTATRGKVLLATVKGDVHDIGKNLVHIILKSNGFDVHDAGIKVAPEALIEAARRLSPDLIGLSGLLARSAQQMISTAEDLKAAGIGTPLLVGGAALSPKFAAARIAPRYAGPVLYAKDAMMGLDLANGLMDPARREGTLAANRGLQARLAGSAGEAATRPAEAVAGGVVSPPPISRVEPPAPPDLKLHVLSDFQVEDVFRYLNPAMLYGKHLGLKDAERRLAARDPKAVEVFGAVASLQDELLAHKLIQARAVFRFYAAAADGDSISLYETPSDPEPAAVFSFPRQKDGQRLCLADFVAPRGEKPADFVGAFVVTCGTGIRELSRRYRERGDYLKSHALQALAIESAEGFAELLHERLRAMWGIGDPASLTLKDKFQARYRGLRVSFGYPACPDLQDQEKLFRLLEPQRHIGVSLTEGWMMDPEASVSALVFHHPEARYFSAGEAVAAR